MSQGDLIAMAIMILQEEFFVVQSQSSGESAQDKLGRLPAFPVELDSEVFESGECGLWWPDIELFLILVAPIVEILLNISLIIILHTARYHGLD
jgi:hypothetical protein